MIAYICGTLKFVQEDSLVIDVGGIGYEVICANPLAFSSKIGTELLIHTYHHVREDVASLYGFKDEDEKYLFTKLISVSGIGPKSAITILGTVHVPDFVGAVEIEDEKYLTQFPGVGKKTARQIILDLKGKLTGIAVFAADSSSKQVTPVVTSELNDAKEALKSLGYSDKEITAIVPQLKTEDLQATDVIIRKALALLAKN